MDTARERLAGALLRAGEGDHDSLRTVYDATHTKLFGICLRILGDRPTAEDVLQDVYVTIWRRAGAFDPGRASPITWMATIARNRAIDRIRARGRRASVPIDDARDAADAAPLAIDMLEGQETSARLHDCLDALETRQQSAIRTAFFEGLSYPELAERIAAPLGTVKSWIRRGLRKLKECLGHGD